MQQLQQPYQSPPPLPQLSQKFQLTDKKFLTHFQQINTPIIFPPSSISSQPTQINKYHLTMSMYSNYISMIDKIADTPIEQLNITQPPDNQDMITIGMVNGLSPKIKQRVTSINNFFNPKPCQTKKTNLQTNQYGLNHYIQNIMNIHISNPSTRTSQQLCQKQQFQQLQKPKLKKIDLLLFEIMSQKKRKGIITNFYNSMQNKLAEFLDYILQDQSDYYHLTLLQKIKKVLKNLQSFKGKLVDGQLKIEMLRIFFQQFRNLKIQYQQQRRQNKPHYHSPILQTKLKKTKTQQLKSTKTKKKLDPFSSKSKNIQTKNDPNISKPDDQQNLWIGQLGQSIIP